MTLGFVVQAAAMAAAGLACWRVARWAGGLWLVNAAATLVVAAARVSCGSDDASWCPPSEHPTSYAVHVAAATVALSALSAAPAAMTWQVRRRGGTWLRSGPALSVLMAGLLISFVVAGAGGWAEKAAVTLGIGWAAAAAVTLPRGCRD